MLVRLIDFAYTLALRCVVKHIGKRAIIEFPVKLTRPSKIWIGDRARVGRYSWLNCSAESLDVVSLRIGNYVHIGRNCHINAWHSVTLADYALISNNVHISDVSHVFDDPEIPIFKQTPKYLGPVEIGYGSWIGYNSVVLPAVSVGRNAIVAALSLVNCNVPDFGMVGGVPARPIKSGRTVAPSSIAEQK